MTSTPLAPPPETKDWTWVLDDVCQECGLDCRTVTGAGVAGLVRDGLPRWQAALARTDVTTRPAPRVWSPLEYACHVRDTCRIFGDRVELMLTQDDPSFPNWDQDASAIEERYWEQNPAAVSAELTKQAERIAAIFDRVEGAQWSRPGLRSNGSRFTVDSLARYFVHDYLHHLWDVGA